MTIPQQIKDAYLAVAAGSKPHEREAAWAIVWAVAQALANEHKLHHWFNNSFETCDGCRIQGWLQEAERRLRETKV